MTNPPSSVTLIAPVCADESAAAVERDRASLLHAVTESTATTHAALEARAPLRANHESRAPEIMKPRALL
jgi:hypothetical protein